jgi:hypothetical protein
MHWWVTIAGFVLIFVILMDAFETVVLPRRIARHFRITPQRSTRQPGASGAE